MASQNRLWMTAPRIVIPSQTTSRIPMTASMTTSRWLQ